jgi:hypothetical protein
MQITDHDRELLQRVLESAVRRDVVTDSEADRLEQIFEHAAEQEA